MELIKSKGSFLSLFLILSLGSFVSLLGMEGPGDDSNGTSSDEEITEPKREWSEKEHAKGMDLTSHIVRGKREQARALLEENPELINYVQPDESNEAVALALQHPRDITFESSSDRDLSTPLLAAMGESEEDIALMKELLDRGANIDLPGSTHHIPIFFEAIRYHKLLNPTGTEPIIRFLAGYDKQIVNRPARGQFPLQFAVTHARNKNIITLLLDLGANPNAQDKEGWTALFNAVYRGNLEAVRTLLARGANPNIEANDGRTADMVSVGSPYYGSSDAAALVAEARTLSTSLLGRLGAGLSSLWNWGSGS